MHFSTEPVPSWWAWRWSRLPGIGYLPMTIRWTWTRARRHRAQATGICSTETSNRARVEALRRRLLEVPKRVGRLEGHVEGERVCDCCERANEYNGFDSGPTIFICPKHCSCHD